MSTFDKPPMTHPDVDEHGLSLPLAHSDVGSVSMCSCGVVTLTLQYLSLRFEPGAFRELQALLAAVQHRLDLAAGRETTPLIVADAHDDVPNMH